MKDELITEIRKIDRGSGEVIFSANISKNELRKGGFYSVIYQDACYFLATSVLSKTALKLAFFLISQADWQDEIDMPQTHVAAATKTDRATINKAFKELEAIKFIYRTSRYGRTIYTLNPNFATRGRHRDQKVQIYEEWLNHRAEEEAQREREQDEASRVLASEANKKLPLKERIDIERVDFELSGMDNARRRENRARRN